MAKRSSVWLWVIALALAALAALSWVRACGLDAKYRAAKSEYVALREAIVAANVESMAKIDALTAALAVKDEAIVKIESDLALKNLELSAAREELSTLQNAEPPTTPEIESIPIVMSLRAQIGKLNDMFSLATGTIALQSREIDELKGKVKLWESVAAEWKAAYERERALRIQAEGLVDIAESRIKTSKTWTKVALGVTAGAIVYGLAK